jgi:hypothetical protein
MAKEKNNLYFETLNGIIFTQDFRKRMLNNPSDNFKTRNK